MLEGGVRQIVGTEVAGWLYFTETGEFWEVEGEKVKEMMIEAKDKF